VDAGEIPIWRAKPQRTRVVFLDFGYTLRNEDRAWTEWGNRCEYRRSSFLPCWAALSSVVNITRVLQ
jgi:hypothetical protein